MDIKSTYIEINNYFVDFLNWIKQKIIYFLFGYKYKVIIYLKNKIISGWCDDYSFNYDYIYAGKRKSSITLIIEKDFGIIKKIKSKEYEFDTNQLLFCKVRDIIENKTRKYCDYSKPEHNELLMEE